jgi:hypothetical protein
MYIGSGDAAGSGGRVRSNVTLPTHSVSNRNQMLWMRDAGPCGVISSVANSNTGLRRATHETGARCRILICFFRLTVSDRYSTRPLDWPACHRQMRW